VDYQRITAIIMGMIMSLIISLNPYIRNEEDVNILYRIVEAEATDGTIEQKKNVAYCVMARVEQKDFPDTVKGVVFAKGQFTPVSDKRYYSVEITNETKKAVNEALMNFTGGHGCTYFCTDCESYRSGFHSRLKEEFEDGMHHYFTE